MWASHVPYNSKNAKAFPYAIGTENDYIYTADTFEVAEFGGPVAAAALGFGAADRVKRAAAKADSFEQVYPYDIASFGARPVAYASSAMGHLQNMPQLDAEHWPIAKLEGYVPEALDTDFTGLMPGINLAGAQTPAWGYAKMAEHAKNLGFESAG